jgi:hypothetical protein
VLATGWDEKGRRKGRGRWYLKTVLVGAAGRGTVAETHLERLFLDREILEGLWCIEVDV